MNVFIGTGRLTRNAVVNGEERRVMTFTIAAKYGYDTEAEEDRVEFISCVMFNPPEKLQEYLAREGKGVLVEFRGRVANSSYEKDGETKYSTEIVVSNRSFNILTK